MMTEEQKQKVTELTQDAQRTLIFHETSYLHAMRFVGKYSTCIPAELYVCLLESMKVHFSEEVDKIIKQIEQDKSTKNLL